MFTTTITYNDTTFVVREPRIIDTSLITASLKKLDRVRITEALGYSADKAQDVINLLLDELYIYSCMSVLLVREQSHDDIVNLFPDLFQDSDTLTQGFIDLYIESNYKTLHDKLTVALNELFNRQMSPELASKDTIDPK